MLCHAIKITPHDPNFKFGALKIKENPFLLYKKAKRGGEFQKSFDKWRRSHFSLIAPFVRYNQKIASFRHCKTDLQKLYYSSF